jgi:hypothetical protein
MEILCTNSRGKQTYLVILTQPMCCENVTIMCHYTISGYHSQSIVECLHHCMNVSYVVGHEQQSSYVSVYRVYSLITDNISMCICEVLHTTSV